jgi:hypothetical protein
MTKKYALYDYASETMLTGPIFDTAQEALGEIDTRLVNIMVVGVDVPEFEAPTKTFNVVALEKFVVRTFYYAIEASTPEEAEELCRTGQVAYDEKHIEEGDEEWIETLSIEENEE